MDGEGEGQMRCVQHADFSLLESLTPVAAAAMRMAFDKGKYRDKPQLITVKVFDEMHNLCDMNETGQPI